MLPVKTEQRGLKQFCLQSSDVWQNHHIQDNGCTVIIASYSLFVFCMVIQSFKDKINVSGKDCFFLTFSLAIFSIPLAIWWLKGYSLMKMYVFPAN